VRGATQSSENYDFGQPSVELLKNIDSFHG